MWAKGEVIGTGSEAGNINSLAGVPLYNDIYNYGINKQLNQLVKPLAVVISGSYTTPRFSADGTGMKAVSQVLRDWQLGWLLRYQSGDLIASPPSNNQLNLQLARASNLDRGSVTFWNRVAGVNPLNVDPNCHCFNPQTTLVLNKNAWTDAPAGTFGTAAAFYNDIRWQRQPAESLSFGRNFRMGKEGRYNLFVRAEFQNIFNRLFLSKPSVGAPGFAGSNQPSIGALTNPATVPNTSGGVYTGGYGYLATLGGAGAQPRAGQIVARFTF